MGQTLLQMTVDDDIAGQCLQQPILQAVAQLPEASRIPAQLGLCQGAGGPQADDAGYVERTRAQTAFLPTPLNQRSQLQRRTATAHEQCPLPFGAIDLVRRD